MLFALGIGLGIAIVVCAFVGPRAFIRWVSTWWD
jgi:hypothetical protein